jgi:hypothetical protein
VFWGKRGKRLTKEVVEADNAVEIFEADDGADASTMVHYFSTKLRSTTKEIQVGVP